jgi:hypothetical protein
MLPGYAPYPRYGRVAKPVDADHVLVTQVQCGDPRCAAEHLHADTVWNVDALHAVQAYQPRADWEEGRKSSPNVPVA